MHELSAFIRAVDELFGAEQARLSTEDWLDELELRDVLPRATSRDWRAVTVAASARFANRGILARDRRNSQKYERKTCTERRGARPAHEFLAAASTARSYRQLHEVEGKEKLLGIGSPTSGVG